VRYELNAYILFRKNTGFEGLIHCFLFNCRGKCMENIVDILVEIGPMDVQARNGLYCEDKY
jgi:hypothetical protein